MHKIAILSIATGVALAGPALQWRQDPTNLVRIASETDHCVIVPRDPRTNIGDSEFPGGETTYCTVVARTSEAQGQLPNNFWRNIEYKAGNGVNGSPYVQLTGCINPDTLDRLNADDPGGQYDSNGGADGQGNPSGSTCIGWGSYVEIVEPAVPRMCIRCCNDPSDCPTNMDTSGCPAVIPGNYFDCS